MSTTKDIFKHTKGSYERLTTSNYTAWRNSSRRLLRATGGWQIVEGTELPPPAPAGTPAQLTAGRTAIKDYEQRKEDAAMTIYTSCSLSVRVYIDEIDDPQQMWTILANRLDTASTAVGRQAIYRQFCGLRPTPGEPIGDYFTKLMELRNQINGTPEAISDVAFRTHVFASLPSAFEVTAKIQQNRPDAIIESIIDALKEDESIRAMRVQPDANTDAFMSRGDRGGYRGGRGRYGLRSNNTNRSYPEGQWCTFCNTPTHNTTDCRSKQFGSGSKRQHENSSNVAEDSGPTCWHCGDTGHRISKCPIKRRGDEARAKGPKRLKPEANVASVHGEREAGGGF